MGSAEDDDEIGGLAGGEVYKRLGGDFAAADPAGVGDQAAEAAGEFGGVSGGLGQKLLRHLPTPIGGFGVEEPSHCGGAYAFEAGRGHGYDYNPATE